MSVDYFALHVKQTIVMLTLVCSIYFSQKSNTKGNTKLSQNLELI